MKKNKGWHFNKDYRSNDTLTGIFVFVVLIITLLFILFSFNDRRFDKYHWDVEEYMIMEGDTVDAVIKEYHDTWCVGTGVTFETYRDRVYKLNSDKGNLNVVYPGDIIKIYYNPTER